MSSENIQTRNRILKASLDLLEADKGKGVRMSDIAKRTGVSRQAVYLHFKTRAELLIATTRYLDEIKQTDQRLHGSRTAKSGIERLNAYIEAWGAYIPEVYPIAKALMAMQDTDEAAKEAWSNRMQAMREGCAAAIEALDRDNALTSDYSVKEATDILWTLLSVRNWEQFTMECGWSQDMYIQQMKKLAKQCFL